MAIRPFDPYAEYYAKRYKYDESLGFGKFNRPYYEPKFDLFGSQIAMASFKDSDVPRIEHLLPRGSYVPRTDQLEAWNVKRVGKEWDKRPDAMLKAYSVDRYGDIDSNKFIALGKKVYLASSEKSIATEGWRCLMIDSHRATFCNRGHAECLFVPVFFNEESLLGY